MKLSVLIVTYNHERYINQALDSVLMQAVDFDYEIVIGEDCSTDRTREIVQEYQKKNPDKIRLLLPEKNLGAAINFMRTFKACQGQYIAYLEGDDYWTSPHKLQAQVEYLDKHPECAICFHNCEEFYDDGSKASCLYCSADQKEISKLEDLIAKCNFIPSCSVLFRNNLFSDFPYWYNSLCMGDWTLHLLNAQYGDIGYINQVMSKHRNHGGGTWSSRRQSKNILDVIAAYRTVNRHFNYKYNDIISMNISAYYFDLFRIYLNSKDKAKALKYLYYSLGPLLTAITLSPGYLIYFTKLLLLKFRKL